MNTDNHLQMVVLDNEANKRNTVWQLSWTSIKLFLQCPRCFYNQQKLGIKRPGNNPETFAIFRAIEESYKKELNRYRAEGKTHPIITEHNIEAIPYANDLLEIWRNPYGNYGQGGIRFCDKELGVELFGGVDDLWITPCEELIIVEYKTSSSNQPIYLDHRNKWHREYMQQVSFYAWLFKRNNYKVHQVCYFLFCNGHSEQASFEQVLRFDNKLLPYLIDDSWVEECVAQALNCLEQENPPMLSHACEYCRYTLQSADQEISQRLQLWNIAYGYALNYAKSAIEAI